MGIYDDFKEKIAKIESGGNYKAKNPNTSARGKYQFLLKFWMPHIKKFACNINLTEEMYLNDPNLQEDFMDYYIKTELERQLPKLKKVNDVCNLNDHQLMALVHFLGIKGALNYLKAGGVEPNLQHNITVKKYMDKMK